MDNRKATRFILALATVAAFGTTGLAHADEHKVVKRHTKNLRIKAVLENHRPTVGVGVPFLVHVELKTYSGDHHKKFTYEPITDATLHTHIGHEHKDEGIALVHDASAPGTYRGTLKFAHGGKEVVRVRVTRPDEKDYRFTFTVVTRKPKHHD